MLAFSPNKKLSQHFLHDKAAAARIVGTLEGHDYTELLEIGPGTGALTEHLLHLPHKLHAVEVDPRAVAYLRERFGSCLHVYEKDVTKMDLKEVFSGHFGIIGNLPYSVSSLILFKLLDLRAQVSEAILLLQKEMAQRLAAPPGSKQYGLLSVLLQAYYKVKYCFTLPPAVFSPRPKVHSGLLRMERLPEVSFSCPHEQLVEVVKLAFRQRRKKLSNALSRLGKVPEPFANLRAEQLSVADFVTLTADIFGNIRNADKNVQHIDK